MKTDRIPRIDALRGFALLLIFAGNLPMFSGVFLPQSRLDAFVLWSIRVFVDGSAYTLFSLLFGWGLAVQIQRGKDHLWKRRMLFLFVLGLLHGLLLNQADILTVYAILGSLLYLVRKQSIQVLIWFIIILLVSPTLTNLFYWWAAIDIPPAYPIFDPRFSGGLFDVLHARFSQWLLYFLGQLLINFPNIFSAMLIGLVMGRTGFFLSIDQYRKYLLLAGLIGSSLMGTYATIYTWGGSVGLANAAATLGAPLLVCGYIAIAPVWGWLVQVGQMTLSLYILQSLIANALFILAGFYGKMPLSEQGILFLAVNGVQVAVARRLRGGVVEWVWRGMVSKYITVQLTKIRKCSHSIPSFKSLGS